MADRIVDDRAVLALCPVVGPVTPTIHRRAIDRGGIGRIKAKFGGKFGAVVQPAVKQHGPAGSGNRGMPGGPAMARAPVAGRKMLDRRQAGEKCAFVVCDPGG